MPVLHSNHTTVEVCDPAGRSPGGYFREFLDFFAVMALSVALVSSMYLLER